MINARIVKLNEVVKRTNKNVSTPRNHQSSDTRIRCWPGGFLVAVDGFKIDTHCSREFDFLNIAFTGALNHHCIQLLREVLQSFTHLDNVPLGHFHCTLLCEMLRTRNLCIHVCCVVLCCMQ